MAESFDSYQDISSIFKTDIENFKDIENSQVKEDIEEILLWNVKYILDYQSTIQYVPRILESY